MNRNEWVTDAGFETENGMSWVLRYYIQVVMTEAELPVYGLTVEKYTGDGKLAETESTGAFTGSYEEAAALAARFARGTVTPLVLLEMADEWLSCPAY